jgi:hypothetical protein
MTYHYFATGVGDGGVVFVNESDMVPDMKQPQLPALGNLLAIKSGQGEVIFGRGDFGPLSDGIIAETPSGFVGQILRWIPGGKSGQRVGRSTAAYVRHGEVVPMEYPTKLSECRVLASTLDGKTVSGLVNDMAVVWREGRLLKLPKGQESFRDLLITSLRSDGKLGVGRRNERSPEAAVVWREKEGFQTLADYLEEQKIELPKEWTLIDAVSITADGSLITGSARHEDGRVRPFQLQLKS